MKTDLNDRKRAGATVDPDAVDVGSSSPAVANPNRPALRPLRELTGDAWDRMEARANGEEGALPVPWSDLAAVLDPHAGPAALRPGVHVLVGGTGSGKTQLALGLALAAARAGHPVGYVGLELDPVGVVARLAALEWARTRKREAVLPVERWSVLDWPRRDAGRDALHRVRDKVADELDKLPLSLVFGDARSSGAGFTADDFGAVAAEVAKQGDRKRPALVVLDFLQLLSGGGSADDREIRTRIAGASYAANNAARAGECAVLLVSATARDNYGALTLELDKLPDAGGFVGFGKESGEIEYAATSVLVMARADGYPGDRLVAVAKNRHGGTGWAALGWDGSAFYDVGPGRLAGLQAKATAAAPTGTRRGGGTPTIKLEAD